jgi:hypothetical protein
LIRHAFYFLGKNVLCLSKTVAQYIRLRNDMAGKYLYIVADPEALQVCVACAAPIQRWMERRRSE